MKAVVDLARTLHGGTNVYKSRHDCLTVLRAVAALRPDWWTPPCTDFVRLTELVELCERGAPGDATSAPRRHPVLVVEGLDGTGKTLITRTLAEKLRGVAVSTPPPQFATIREAFRHQDEAVARAFYSAANYVAAADIEAKARDSTVVVDRWWCSTCAMALANRCTAATLPPAGDAVYAWPRDLPRPDAGFLLSVDEAVRVARIRKRAPEDAEERRLSAQDEMRLAAITAYERTTMLTVVPAPSYRAAVNSILAELTRRGVPHGAVPFTQEELNSITPF